MSSNGSMRLLIGIGCVAVFGIITFALAAATLGTVNKHHSDLTDLINQQKVGNTTAKSFGAVLANSIRIQDVMTHLKQLQYVATAHNETRAIGTDGFKRTLEYIQGALQNNTNYKVNITTFPVRQFALARPPILLLYNQSAFTRNLTYSNNLTAADFYHVRYSTSISSLTPVQVSFIQNDGCTTADWEAAKAFAGGSLTNRVALIKRGTCSFREKGSFAANYSVTAILFYNHGLTPSDMAPIEVSLGQDTFRPALFLSYPVGQALADAASTISGNVSVQMTIDAPTLPDTQVGNICADTPTGDATQTIVIGSHSDSVPAGPGINDNGSGSAANLGLAIALARLYQQSDYAKYKYRVRFCWWGAEEVGLLGSDDHVKKAKTATTVGDRLQDYLINLNYDMLGSPNYVFGIYEGRTAPNTTNQQAVAASINVSQAFRDWFVEQDLPWDYTNFDGRSDYGPFLAAGIAAGGLFTGADELKTEEQRDRYNRMLGVGRGGTAGIIQDPCYHKSCDSIQNIDVFGYEKMVQAAAYMLEYLGRMNDLQSWLYPNGRPPLRNDMESKMYDSVNEYFRLPYM